jgi:D-xylose transport system substrate-binding protein
VLADTLVVRATSADTESIFDWTANLMARRRTLVMTALAAALVFSTAACGSDDNSSSGSGSSGSGGGEAAGKVGVILPDTTSSPRWESADRPQLSAAFEAAGVDYDIQNANGDAQAMQTIAQQMITSGVTVLAIVNLDSASGAAIEQQAKSQGVKTIDYDRLTLGGSADYYVSYDNTKVGELQGQGLADCLGSTTANIAYLNGSPDDNNATLFSDGAHSVLDKVSTYTQVAEQAVPKWDPQQAATIFEQMYTQAGGNIQGVYAANDTLANAAIGTLSRNGQKIPVTGQDASVQGLQNILAGNQCMTVWKPADGEAKALSETAIALINGDDVKTTGTVKDPEGDRDVDSILLDPISVTKDTLADAISKGAQSASDVCTGDFAALCTTAGIK